MTSRDDEIRREAARKRLEERAKRRGATNSRSELPAQRNRPQQASRATSSRQPATTSRPNAIAWFTADPRRLIAAIAIIAAALILLIALPTCIGGKQASDQAESKDAATSAASGAASASQSEAQSSETESTEPKRDKLIEAIGEEEAEKLLAQVASDDDAAWIAANPDALAFDGPEVQAKVLKLAADDPLALPFVKNFADQYPAEEPNNDDELAMDEDSPTADVPSTSVPHLYQWDRRWGYTVYNADAFGLSGCGPTSLAMIYQAVTGKDDLTPYDMGQLAYEDGFVVEWLGTAGEFFTHTAERIGLSCEELSTTADDIKAALSSGKPVVAHLGAGSFTSYGHFFVLAGLTDDGQVIVNDPYSVTRSSQTWDAELIASESVALYAYSAA